jgi:hypothetical protein
MSVFKKYKAILIALMVLLLSAYFYWQYEHNKEVIAKVGQFEITKNEFEREMHYRGGDNLSALNKKALLEEMISKKLLLNQAYELGLPQERVIQREYNHLLIGKIRERYIEKERKKITISDRELEAFYQEHQEKYRIPNKRQFAILFFKKRLKNTAREKELISEKFVSIEKLYEEGKLPKAQKGFGAYAIDYSEHQVSRYRNGELGWFSEGKHVNWEQKVLDIGFKLKTIGDISSIIETSKGYYLVRLMAEKKERYKSFQKVKSEVRYQLITAKQRKIKEDFYKQLNSKFETEIDLEKLDDFNNSVEKKEKRPPIGFYKGV